MNFQPELAEKVMAGQKTVTRRIANDNRNSPWWIGGCALKVGKDYAVCPGRGKNAIGRVRVLNVMLARLGDVTQLEAEREGFESAKAFADAFRTINNEYDPDLAVWRIGFVVAA